MVRNAAATALALAAASWPSVACALADVAASPYERAVAQAWCGAAPHAALELTGHCPACWVGVALLAGAAAVLLQAPRHDEPAIALCNLRRSPALHL
jgi:hypothetical protein